MGWGQGLGWSWGGDWERGFRLGLGPGSAQHWLSTSNALTGAGGPAPPPRDPSGDPDGTPGPGPPTSALAPPPPGGGLRPPLPHGIHFPHFGAKTGESGAGGGRFCPVQAVPGPFRSAKRAPRRKAAGSKGFGAKGAKNSPQATWGPGEDAAPAAFGGQTPPDPPPAPAEGHGAVTPRPRGGWGGRARTRLLLKGDAGAFLHYS